MEKVKEHGYADPPDSGISYGAMGVRRGAISFLAACSLLCPACDRGGIPREVLDQVRQAHDRMLTVGMQVGEIDPEKMDQEGLDAAFFVIDIPDGDPTPEGHAKARDTALRGIELIRRATAGEAAKASLGLTPGDAYRNEKHGGFTVFIGLGNASAIGTDLALVSDFYERGVRLLTLCGDRDNAVCDSALETASPQDRGLSEFGRKVVAECNRVGMIIDLARASERSLFEVVAASRAPVIVSRATARALGQRPDSLSDDMALALAAQGGVAMVPCGPNLVDHLDHLRKTCGVEAAGIAADIQGDASAYAEITLELFRRGSPESTVEAIWGGNIMRVFDRVAARSGRT